ncbi:MAG: hypothetical protein PHX78_02665 [bacterium]|nr:hypothetical protein [bacterium]
MVRICTIPFIILLFVSVLGISNPVSAGVINPDISVIGQIISKRTDDAALEDARIPTLDLGETELVFDSYLNPYSKGLFVLTAGNEGVETEEAYINIFKGLPGGLALKGGKYRIGFGKLNPAHPHAYSFIESPRVMLAMLPGEDGFNEVGVQASVLLPTTGSWASTISADVIKGSSFHPDETKSSAGWVGRFSNSLLINDTVPLDIGTSVTQGTNNAQWKTKTMVYGADIKTKIPLSGLTNLTLQGEYFYNNSDVVFDSTTGDFDANKRKGFYAFADLKFWERWNAGSIYDQYQPMENKDLTNKTIKYFVGYSLLEETTLFRLAYEKFMPEESDTVHTLMFQMVFSMGPHKVHQF